MKQMIAVVRYLAGDTRGSVLETALVLPILLTMCLGGYEASQLVARSTEIQTAMAEASAITLAKAPENQAEVDVIEDVVEASTGLPDGNVTFVIKYRCNEDTTLRDTWTTCPTDATIAQYVQITITDAYTPLWSDFGIGSTVNFRETRTVQVA